MSKLAGWLRSTAAMWCYVGIAMCVLIAGSIAAGLAAYPRLEARGCVNLAHDVIPVGIQAGTPGTVRFVAVGDTGEANGRTKRVMRAIRDTCANAGCDFVMVLGDVLYPTGADSTTDPAFETVLREFYEPLGLPVLSVLGNHDIKHDALYQVLYSLRSPNWRMPNFRYAFALGGARFFAINTNCSLLAWGELREALEAPFAGWTFVFGHHSLESNGPHGSADAATRLYWDLFLEQDVDFYVSGHNHDLEYLSASGQRSQYVVSGAGGAAPDNPDWTPERPSGGKVEELFQYRRNGFAWFEVTADAVTIRFYDDAGERLKGFTRTRTPPAS